MSPDPKKEPMNEIARADQSSAIELLPPGQAPSAVARQMLVAHAEMMQTAWELASKMVNTRMVPARFFGKAEDATAAILYGAELGLNPIQSLQRVIPIHGMPSLEARTMVALLKAKGYRIRVLEQSDDSVTVEGFDLDGERYESTWTIERARRAGYVPEIDEKTGKYKTNANGKLKGNEKYITDPQAMLKAKAQAEVCRDMAPDVLMGISYTSEELESERWDNSALPAPAAVQRRGRPAAITVDEILDDAPAGRQPERPVEQPEPGPVDEPVDVEAETSPDGSVAEQPAEPESSEPEREPESEPKKAPAKKSAAKNPAEPKADMPEKSATRKALEKRLFTLIGGLDPELAREDRLVLYRFVIGRNDIRSTDDLTDVEVTTVADQLYTWQQNNELDAKVNDAIYTVALADAENTNTEGK